MRKLLNTIYNTKEMRYLSLDRLNIVISEDNTEIIRVPLHNIEQIVTVGYTGVSPALMGACAENNISLCFLKPNGDFLARVTGKTRGNVLLRKLSISRPETLQYVLKSPKILLQAKFSTANGL